MLKIKSHIIINVLYSFDRLDLHPFKGFRHICLFQSTNDTRLLFNKTVYKQMIDVKLNCEYYEAILETI